MGQNKEPGILGVRLPLSGSRASIPISLGSGRVLWIEPGTWRVNLTDLWPEDVAYGLANICRFTGGCKRYYSDAEHSVILYQMTGDPWSLLHDAHEMLGFGDVNSNLKGVLGFDIYYQATKEIDHQIAERFKTTLTDVSEQDKLLGAWEARCLTSIPVECPPGPRLFCWDTDTARKEWLRCWSSLSVVKG